MKKSSTADIIMIALKILVGSAIYAAGFRYLMYPNSIVSGGVTGIAMILNLLIDLPVGVLIIIMNIPLFLMGWRRFGFGFMGGSLVGMLTSSIMVDILSMYPITITSEPLLGAVYGGVTMGFGLGIVYTAGVTTGGVDIAAKLLQKRFRHINFGTMILILDASIIASFAVIFQEYDSALYAVISSYIVSKLVDFMLYGALNSRLCYIITQDAPAISKEITGRIGRGATLMRAKGAYTGDDKDVILCAIQHRQIVTLRHIVRELDSTAFIIVCDAREVFGLGFSSLEEN